MPATPFSIEKIEFWTVDVAMTDPFVVATGTRTVAENIFVRVSLSGGAHGYGEAAPFPEVGGEDRRACLLALNELGRALLHRTADRFEDAARLMQRLAPDRPAARCALETALIDAYCRARTMPMWKLWGEAALRNPETDITIPICDLDKTVELARGWHARGFRLFKMKVGKDVDQDIKRLEAVHQALPGLAFIGDGNQGFSREECLAFSRGVTQSGAVLSLLEQPLVRDDLEGLAAIRSETGIPVAADESVRSLSDAERVVKAQAADYVNIKIMKTGVIQAREIARYALQRGLKLMIGGMVETRIAMGCSLSLVLGMDGFDVLDLDTPLLLRTDPVVGGYSYHGPKLQVSKGPGLDALTRPEGHVTILR